MATLQERIAWIVAQKVLVLPPDFDRRGFYSVPTAEPSPPQSSCAAQRTPYIGD